MQKYITRTFNVKTGVKLEPDYQNKCFREVAVTLIDEETPPSDVHIDEENIIKVRMPLNDFFNLGEKIVIGKQENLPETNE